MVNTITCPQCGISTNQTESHCSNCNADLSSVRNPEAFEHDETMMTDEDEEEELRTVRMEGFTSESLAASGMSFEQFMSQDERTVVGASGEFANASSGSLPQAGAAPFVGSGEFPQAGGSPYAPPVVQPQSGYVFVEGSDSPSMTVRQEAPGFSGGRDEPMPTYSGPVDISRASASTSPFARVLWFAGVLVAGVVGFFLFQSYFPSTEKTSKPKIVMVMLEIATTPIGAEVWINGKKFEQTTPATIQSRIGERVYVQIRKKNYKTVDFTWPAKGNDQRRFTLTSTAKPKPKIDPKLVAAIVKKLKKRKTFRRRKRRYRIPANHGSLYIITDPPGAKVLVDGRVQRGRTPLRLHFSNGLEAKMTVQKYGHFDASFVWKFKAGVHAKKTIRMYRHSWYSP